jgi:dTDP-4-amino-4,6-dideoxygalactose transaminase
MPVHFGGQACDLQQIYEVAARHNLAVVEDAAHAIGTVYHQHLIGSDQLQTGYPGLRRATVFSFYATKNMTTAEGGLITTNDDALAETMRLLTLHGMSRDAWKRYTSAGSWYYEVVLPGYKANMTDIQAAMGLHQLRRLPDFIETRQQYAAIYDRAFATMSEVEIPLTHSERNHVYHLYALRLNLEQLTIDRAQFIEGLKACGIGTSVHFIPVHLHPLYQRRFNYRQGDLPQAEAIYEQIVSLPLYPSLTVEDINDVVQAVIYVIGTNRRSYHETNLH